MAIVKFNEKAKIIYAMEQRAEGYPVVRTSSEVHGTIAISNNSSTVTGTGTKFKDLNETGDALGDVVIGAYLYSADGTIRYGKITAIASNTSLTLDTAVTPAVSGGSGFSVGFGPDNAIPTINLSYETNIESSDSSWDGDELNRDGFTTISDKYCTVGFETFMPRICTIDSAAPEANDIPLYDLFHAIGADIILDNDGSGSAYITNTSPVKKFLTIEVRKSSQDDVTIDKTYLIKDARGSASLDGTIKNRAMLKWNFMGNYGGLSDKTPIILESTIYDSLKTRIAPIWNQNFVTQAQLSPYSGTCGSIAPDFVGGLKNICFTSFSDPNITGFTYSRYRSSCEDGWTKTASQQDITLTIFEEKQEASYDAYNELEKNHSLWLWFNTEGGVYMSLYYDKLQLVNVSQTTIDGLAGLTLTLRNYGNTQIRLLPLANTNDATINYKPKFGYGPAILASDTASLTTLLEGMTDIPSSVVNTKAGTFTLVTTSGNFGWCAVTQTAYTAGGTGVTFTDEANATGGWCGAGEIGSGDFGDETPTTTNVTLVYEGVTWRFFRQNYVNADPTPGQDYTIS